MELGWQHFLGIFISLAVVFGVGIYAGHKIRSSVDFSVSDHQAGTTLVAGTLMGTLIGGASTVGTAQLAFLSGLSAWWFTLGAGLSCLIIALFLAKPLWETRFETVPQFLSSSYGPAAGVIASLFLSLGMFINVVPQVFSSVALLLPILPLNTKLAAFISVSLMALYVIFGGLWGTGLMGISKVLLTCASLLTGGLLAFKYIGGFSGLSATFPPYPWFSLFGRGINTDLASAFSLILGVLSSQIYFQAIFSSKNLRVARTGALISALLGPAIGFGGILIGLYMRANFPNINPALALPLFILNYMPPLFAGIALATLLLAAIGTGAGLTLGISTMLSRDIYQRLKPNASDRHMLFILRFFILLIMALTFATTFFADDNVLIQQWSYLSLGLRGSTICFPLLSVIFLKNKISPLAGTLAVLLSPASVIIGTVLRLKLNPLYIGLAVGLGILFWGFLFNPETKDKTGYISKT
ncbi:MAG: sodium:solute symporter family protein [Dethiobacteria bacterium]|jgi:SSS family solute:Na+ symporter